MIKRTISLTIVIYIAISATYAFLLPILFKDNQLTPGTFGDMFGAFNAFFSGLAFIGVIYTIFLQTKQVEMQSDELRLQREELEQTRLELARSATAQEKTEISLSNQLRINQITSQLSAIPLLLREEINHIKKHHQDDMGKNDIESFTEEQIAALIVQLDERIRSGTNDAKIRCLLRNVKRVKSLRADMKNLYNELTA